MSATNSFEAALLNLIFPNTNAANIGDATGLRGSTAPGVFYISLHTADPGETGTQTTSETAYTNYARVSVVRSGAQWSISGTAPTVATNVNAVTFPTGGVTGSTITHFGIGSDVSGAGNLFLKGPLSVSLPVSSGITPSFAAGQLSVSLD